MITPCPIVLPLSLKANLYPSEQTALAPNLILTSRLFPGIPTLTLSGSKISAEKSAVFK